MKFPTDVEKWIGKFIVLDWNTSIEGSTRKMPTNSGGRALRVDDTYLYLQPFGMSAQAGYTEKGAPVTRLGLKVEEEIIPLVDIDTIYAAPLDGITIDE
jgi:hypothetical protein